MVLQVADIQEVVLTPLSFAKKRKLNGHSGEYTDPIYKFQTNKTIVAFWSEWVSNEALLSTNEWRLGKHVSKAVASSLSTAHGKLMVVVECVKKKSKLLNVPEVEAAQILDAERGTMFVTEWVKHMRLENKQ